MTALSQHDLTALTERELGVKLNEIDSERARITDEANASEQALAKALVILTYDPKNQAAKAEAITQRSFLKICARSLKDLRERQSAIQSIIKLQGFRGGI